MSLSVPGKCCEYELACRAIRFVAHHRAISLLIGWESGSKFDLCIHAVALVLSVRSFEHGWGELSYMSWIF